MAVLFFAQGNYAQAEQAYQESLAIFERALGSEHLKVATSLEDYAVVLHAMHRDDEAAEMEARAAEIQAKHAQQSSAE